MTQQNVFRSKIDIKLTTYIKLYKKIFTFIYHEMRNIKKIFREIFFAFFKIDLINLHKHVNDAINSNLLNEFISHVMNNSIEIEYKH